MLPTLQKTWQRVFNIGRAPSGTLETDLDWLFIDVIAALVGVGQSPITVVGSSDSTAAGLDGVNRITDPSKLVRALAGSAHSWLVTGNGSAGQHCFDFVQTGASAAAVNVVWSPGGLFTGGSTTARPTATDAQVWTSYWWAGSPPVSGAQFRAHVLRSTDGQNTRVFICHSGVAVGLWAWDRVASAAEGWENPNVVAFVGPSGGSNATPLIASSWYGYDVFAAVGPAGAMPLRVVGEGMCGSSGNSVLAAYNGHNEVTYTTTGKTVYPIKGVGLFSSTVGMRGSMGYVPDMFFTVGQPLDGDTFPVDGTRLFAALGDMLVPTAGETLLIG